VYLLSERELGACFAAFRVSAFRFEIRDQYNSDVGREAFRRFLAGEPDDYSWHRPWVERLRRDTSEGKAWQRVRIVSVPLSDWSRYALKVAQLSAEGGEDIRYLRRDRAQALGLAPLDCWIFDDSLLVHLHFDEHDHTFLGGEVVDRPEVLRQHLEWRTVAMRHSRPIAEFARTPT
jgi:hypothetical protein